MTSLSSNSSPSASVPPFGALREGHPKLALSKGPTVEWGPTLSFPAETRAKVEALLPPWVAKLHLQDDHPGLPRRARPRPRPWRTKEAAISGVITLSERPARGEVTQLRGLLSAALGRPVQLYPVVGQELQTRLVSEGIRRDLKRTLVEATFPVGVGLHGLERFVLTQPGGAAEFYVARVSYRDEHAGAVREWTKETERSLGAVIVVCRGEHELPVMAVLRELSGASKLLTAEHVPQLERIRSAARRAGDFAAPSGIEPIGAAVVDYRELPWKLLDSSDTRKPEDAFAIIPRPMGGVTLYWSVAEGCSMHLQANPHIDLTIPIATRFTGAAFALNEVRPGIVGKFVFDRYDHLRTLKFSLGLIRPAERLCYQQANEVLTQTGRAAADNPSDAALRRLLRIAMHLREERLAARRIIRIGNGGGAQIIIEEGMQLFGRSLKRFLSSHRVPTIAPRIDAQESAVVNEFCSQLREKGYPSAFRTIRQPVHTLMLLKALESDGEHSLLGQAVDILLGGEFGGRGLRVDLKDNVAPSCSFKSRGIGRFNQMQAVAALAGKRAPFSAADLRAVIGTDAGVRLTRAERASELELLDELISMLPQTGGVQFGQLSSSNYLVDGRRVSLVQLPGLTRAGIVPALDSKHRLLRDGKTIPVVLQGYDIDAKVFVFLPAVFMAS